MINKNINWLKEKCDWDDAHNPALIFSNYRDTRPIVIKRCVMNEWRAEQRKRFWKHLREYAKPIAGGVVLAVGMWLLLVMLLVL